MRARPQHGQLYHSAEDVAELSVLLSCIDVLQELHFMFLAPKNNSTMRFRPDSLVRV